MPAIPEYKYKESLDYWEKVLREEPDAKKRAELFLQQGVKQVDDGAVVFDPILTCEALGEAECADAIDMQAEAYKRIGMLWGRQYPALSLSVWRQAERLYNDLGQANEINFLKLNLALSCFLTGEKYEPLDTQLAEQFREEARQTVRTVTEPEADASNIASFRYTKGTIIGDAVLLRQARAFYEQEQLWDAAIQCLDEEIRLLIAAGNRRQALPLMQLVKQYATTMGDAAFARSVDENIAHIDQLQNGPRLFILPDDNKNLLDVLDLLAYTEVRVVFGKMYKAHRLASGYIPQQGKFIVLQDGKLMPSFREHWRMYRGESEFHADCKPTLWRKDMNDKLRFVERMKFVEFDRALRLLPEYKTFRSGFMIQDPDGRPQKVTPNVDSLGLAQHYGVKTELMDLTADKWVAAFFASTKYNRNDDTYRPIVDETDQHGVIYHLPIRLDDVDKIHIVGAQPFERPTAQAAFMMELKRDENFNDICDDSTLFRQHPIISLIVYHYANRAGRLFPPELIQRKAWQMVKQADLSFSPATIQEARRRFPNDMDNAAFEQIASEITVDESGASLMPVSNQEQVPTQEHWLRHQRLCSKIETIWFGVME